MIGLVMTVSAVVLFVLAALNVSSPRVHLGWAGAALLALRLLVAY